MNAPTLSKRRSTNAFSLTRRAIVRQNRKTPETKVASPADTAPLNSFPLTMKNADNLLGPSQRRFFQGRITMKNSTRTISLLIVMALSQTACSQTGKVRDTFTGGGTGESPTSETANSTSRLPEDFPAIEQTPMQNGTALQQPPARAASTR